MSKTIIGVYGRKNEGKSETLNNVIKIFASSYPSAKITYLIPGADVLAIIEYKFLKIGIESQGDPGSRMLTKKTVESLAAIHKCDVIVCATRTSGETVTEVDRVAALFRYYTIWKSTYYTPDLNTKEANKICAEEIADLIIHLISGRL